MYHLPEYLSQTRSYSLIQQTLCSVCRKNKEKEKRKKTTGFNFVVVESFAQIFYFLFFVQVETNIGSTRSSHLLASAHAPIIAPANLLIKFISSVKDDSCLQLLRRRWCHAPSLLGMQESQLLQSVMSKGWLEKEPQGVLQIKLATTKATRASEENRSWR